MFEKMLPVMLAAAVFACAMADTANAEEPEPSPDRASQLMREGNYREAADMFQKLAFEESATPKDAIPSLTAAWQCFQRIDGDRGPAMLDAAVSRWPDSWRIALLETRLITDQSHGVHFSPRPSAASPSTYTVLPFSNDSLRARLIARLARVEPSLDDPRDPATPEEKIDFYDRMAGTILFQRTTNNAWRLTSLTDLEKLRDDAYEHYGYSPHRGAPVDADGDPVLYPVPSTWESAANDGERWRWALARMAAVSPAGKQQADLAFGIFLRQQFGVHTAANAMPLPQGVDIAGEVGSYAVRTLDENETIALLATGLKRFTLPAGFNFIAALRRVAEADERDPGLDARIQLAQEFENRQQFDKALALWREAAAMRPDETWKNVDNARQRIQTANAAASRITANAGLLEPGPVAPAGKQTTLSFLYRNGDRVDFVALRLDEKQFLNDIRAGIRSGERFAEWLEHPTTLPDRILGDKEKYGKYILETAAEWSLPLSPLPAHRSSRIPVDLPALPAGCYLVEARMRDGNTSRLAVRIADLALVKKDLPGQLFYYVADATSGEPVAGATVTLTGFSRSGDKNGKTIYKDVRNIAEYTDANGLVTLDPKDFHNMQWLVTAETNDGRMAHLGTESYWSRGYRNDEEKALTAFSLTDRPVYRPGQEVHFKAWIGRGTYADGPDNRAGKTLILRIQNPMGDVVLDEKLATDAYGGVSGTFSPGENAVLGQYFLSVFVENGNHLGGGWFRLEEYKKPEFEVTLDTPSEALPLGDAAQLKIRANYYYGAPVTRATVKYTIVRSTFTQDWTPPWRWDWLFGKGAAYRGHRPGPGIFPPRWQYEPPEVVADGEGVLDPDGVFRLTLDTAPAKEFFGDRDHSYDITVEVTDQSRRTIVGSGRVVASREPFAVKVWTNQGFYRAGREIRANIKSLLPSGGGIAASGTATLYRIRHDENGAPSRHEVESRDMATDARGDAELRWNVKEAGQYVLLCRLVDAKQNAVTGETEITVRGETGDADFRFAALELAAERREYRPGDTVRIAVGSENKDAVVLLFPRAERWIKADPTPRALRLVNGVGEIELEVGRADQPNFFCEAVTIYEGKVYSETCEIFVPPADKTLTVDIGSDKENYLPGEKAEFTVTVKDAAGEPIQGQVAISLYDRSVEYIAGGSNAGDIKAHFWSGTRHYFPIGNSSLDAGVFQLTRRDDKPWQPIGVFGYREADWNDDALFGSMSVAGRGGIRMRSAPVNAAVSSALVDAAPPAPMMMAAEASMAYDEADAGPARMRKQAAPTGGGMTEPSVRSEFADTALWIAALETDVDGRASFSLAMPENLTAWTARAWAMATATRVGEGRHEVETKKNVVIRPQAPRFLTQKDQVILSANLHNYLPRRKTARAELILEGGLLEADDAAQTIRTLELAANGEARVDWLVHARRPGDARVVMRLLTDEESDAAEIIVPIIVHGARRVENFGGVLRGEETEQTLRFTVPADRLPEQSHLQLSFSPSIVSSMIEALPYLIEYPYGCTEQTLNRFLPVVMTRSYLDRMGVSLADAGKRLDNALTDTAAEAWKETFGDRRAAARPSPVFDEAELEKMVKTGVERLTGMQNADGGWGWFSGSGERSYPHTTAVVVYGLATARDHGAAVPMGVLDSGVRWLAAYRDIQIARLKMKIGEAEEKHDLADYGNDASRPKKAVDNTDAFVHMILTGLGHSNAEMRDFLYRDRLELSLTGLSMLGLSLHADKQEEALAMVRRNLSQYVETNPAAGTAWLKTPKQGWWWWYNDAIESQAWYLKLLSRTEPDSDLPAALAKYLLQNRKNGTYWRSTRDTAYAIEALSEYASASGEIRPDMTVTLYLDGRQVLQRKLDHTNILADHRFSLSGLAVETGEHELRLVRSGPGSVYFTGSLDVFSLEDPIPAAGSDLKVTRSFSRLTPDDTQTDYRTASGVATQGRVERFIREEISGPFSPETPIPLQGGDLVEVTLRIECANEYEYLVFEDMKAAGLEAVELRSGYSGNTLGAYVEYRDQKVVLFLRHLSRGVHEVRYRFRAEIPGAFSALPVFGGGMYATELFCNSDEMKITVTESGVFE